MIKEIEPAVVMERLNKKEDIILLDVREEWEYQINHLNGALHVPLGEIPRRSSTLDPHKEIVVYCHHGVRSHTACMILRQQGFINVKNLKGGIEAWADIDPAVKHY